MASEVLKSEIFLTTTTSRKTENPWTIYSIYDLQYFNCPTCEFKNQSKQEFIDHVYEIHPEAVEDLTNVGDDSLEDIKIPWNQNSTEIKSEDDILAEEQFEVSLNIDYEENNDSDYIFPAAEQLENDDFTEKNTKIGIKRSNNNADDITDDDNFPTSKRPKKKRFFNCECCDWKGENIKKHWTENHNKEDYPFLCEKCDYRGLTYIHLDSHKREKHNSK